MTPVFFDDLVWIPDGAHSVCGTIKGGVIQGFRHGTLMGRKEWLVLNMPELFPPEDEPDAQFLYEKFDRKTHTLTRYWQAPVSTGDIEWSVSFEGEAVAR